MDQEKYEQLVKKVWRFMEEHIYPNEATFHHQSEEIAKRDGAYWVHPPIVEELMQVAKQQGIWNLWLPNDTARIANLQGITGGGLNNLQYAKICEILGTGSHMEFAPQVTNCSSPDTGNMETIARYGTQEQKERWLRPLLEGKIRSCYAMTERNVASSDASNISIDIKQRGEHYVINGEKTYITGAGSQHCKIMILMGKTSPAASKYKQQSTILVPMDTPGITLVRPMAVFGELEAPKGHMEIHFKDVVVPCSNVLLGEGRGFEIAQGRLGPGRIHHCMRLIGTGERAISAMVKRASSREAFGKQLIHLDTVLQDVGRSRAELDQCRMVVCHAAHLLDTVGNKVARKELAIMKAVVPRAVQRIVDRAIQVHGAVGVSQDSFLAEAFVWARMCRIADGPDEVHWRTAARIEVQQQQAGDNPLYRLDLSRPARGSVHRRSTDPIPPEVMAKL